MLFSSTHESYWTEVRSLIMVIFTHISLANIYLPTSTAGTTQVHVTVLGYQHPQQQQPRSSG